MDVTGRLLDENQVNIRTCLALNTYNNFFKAQHIYLGFPGGSAGKESTCHAGHLGSIPGLGRCPG